MGYYWYEDLLAEDDLYGYTKLRPQLRIPILATEYAPSGLYGHREWIRQQATGMLRGDVALKGGITPMIKIAHLAEAFRMKCDIHHGGNSLNNVVNLHLTMAVPNCEYFEVLQRDAAQKHGPGARHQGRCRGPRPRADGAWSGPRDRLGARSPQHRRRVALSQRSLVDLAARAERTRRTVGEAVRRAS